MRSGTTLAKLQRKLKKLERKFEKTPEGATLDRERIIKSAQAVERSIKKFKEAMGKV